MKDIEWLIQHQSEGHKIIIFPDNVTYQVGSRVFSFKSDRLGKIAGLILSAHPKIVTYQTIIDKIGFADEKQSIHKYLNKINYALRQATQSKDRIFESITNQGCRLIDDWQVTPHHKIDYEIQNAMDTILDVSEKSIDYMRIHKITSTRGGIKYIDLDETLVLQNFQVMNREMRKLLYCLSTPQNTPDIMALKNKLVELTTYVTFLRIGDNLTDEKWRQDYENELRFLINSLKTTIITAQR